MLSVIIPTMAGRKKLLEKLLSTLPGNCERIIVADEDLLLAAKRNKGAKQATGEYLLFIDDDNFLNRHSIGHMIARFSKDVGVMGMMACYDNNKKLIADGGSKRNYLNGFTTGINTNRNRSEISHDPYEVDEVANAFMVRRSVFQAIGGFDEENFPIDLDEADLCKRIKALGLKILMNPAAVCYHKSQTYSFIPDFRRPMNAFYMGRNRIIYQRKHLSSWHYAIYLIFFMPAFVFSYCVSLIYRRKPIMIIHFLKGIFSGLYGSR